jgi:hypothetical protein
MLQFYSFFLTTLRIFIFAKLVFLFWMTSSYPESYPISLLTWWIYFLVFDLWLYNNITSKEINQDTTDEKE